MTRTGIRLGLSIAVVALLSPAMAPKFAAAEPEPESASTSSPFKRYQTKLEAEAKRILAPEVKGEMKDALGRRGTDLWACTSVAAWQQVVTGEAATLSRACQALARRSEEICAEERLADAYASPIVQTATVQAFQRGLGAVLALLGVEMTPAAPTTAPAAANATPVPRAPVTSRGVSASAQPLDAAVAAAAAARKPIVFTPVELAAYTVALEKDTYRILSAEIEGSVLDGVLARRTALRAAMTVAAWKAALGDAHPSLAKTAAVLERRTEVLRTEQHVLDPYDSVPTQQAALRGLQQGLERILKQFGK